MIAETGAVIKAAVASVLAMLAWWCRRTWLRMDSIETHHDELKKEMAHVQVLVAGQYVTRDHLAEAMRGLWKRLDHIEAKLDVKADK